MRNLSYGFCNAVSESQAIVITRYGKRTVFDLLSVNEQWIRDVLDVSVVEARNILWNAHEYHCACKRELMCFQAQPRLRVLTVAEVAHILGIDIGLAGKLSTNYFIAGREIIMAARTNKLVGVTEEENQDIAISSICDSDESVKYGIPVHIGNEFNEEAIQNIPPGISSVICYDGSQWDKWALGTRMARLLSKPGYVLVARHVVLDELPGFTFVESGERYVVYRSE